MIIPMRCFNCGQILSSKYNTYINLINSPILIKREDEKGVYYVPASELESWDKQDEVTLEDRNNIIQNTLKDINDEHKQLEYIRNMKDANTNIDNKAFVLSRQVPNGKNTVEGTILTQLGLTRYCCRTHMIGHVPIIDKL